MSQVENLFDKYPKELGPIYEAALLVIDGTHVDRGALVFSELVIAHLCSKDGQFQEQTVLTFKQYCFDKRNRKGQLEHNSDIKAKGKRRLPKQPINGQF